ncbi:MAG: PIN domain-containing protein [Thermoguttaceae bacterium]|jgi:tRNA(fMet)-specific endonuclease VapC
MFLLDTDTLVFILRGQQKVLENFNANLQYPRAMSIISHGELLYGALKSRRPIENAAKVRHLCNLIPLVEVSPAIIETYAALRADLEKSGRRIDEFDLIIASSALFISYTLVTNNQRHFSNIPGLNLKNWSS